MARPKKEQYEVDDGDGLVRGIVGSWSIDKHRRLERYVHASHGARRRFHQYSLQTTFIDLYCGPGRARIRDSLPKTVIDGSAVIAAKTAASCTRYGRYVLGDVDTNLVDACATRLAAVGVSSVDKLVGPAERTVETATRGLQNKGLHFALVDPFNIDLPFSVLSTLGELPKMDLLIHFSIMDLSRNLNTMKEDGRLDSLAPGWSRSVTSSMGIDQQRMTVFGHWRSLLENKLRYKVSDRIVKVRGPNKAQIYWLVFASRHDLGGKLWKEIVELSPQPQQGLFA